MRIDDFLSSVGVIKRRTIAKELGQNGLIHVNDTKVKPAYQVKVNDIIKIKGTHPKTVEVLQLPISSVPKEKRDLYIKELD
ncbi:MAG: RNA-binding S4 domain-containing protein [Calditrichaeota bacterium]|nr:MAG: RNA-binding S4 domain-containing protein [Calditrichota bacterium]